MNGCLALRAGVRDGHSVLLECQGTYPLQVLRPHVGTPADGSLSLIVLFLSGGLLDGDDMSIDVKVEPGARLQLRTQAATQVHAGRSTQQVRVSVGADAWFSYLPHALVPHAEANYGARTFVEMERGARVLLADVLSPGRVHHGEEFLYQQVRLDLDVWCANALIARERALIQPDASLRSAQFGPLTHTAGVYLLDEATSLLVEPCRGVRVGASQLARGGHHVRVLANRAVDLEATLGRLHAAWWKTQTKS